MTEKFSYKEVVPVEQEREIQLISDLIADIENHNHEHSPGALWGKSLARGLGGVLEDKNFDFETAQRETGNEMSASTHVSLTELLVRHGDTLKKFGLNLVHKPSRTESASISGEVFLKVINSEKYIALIKSLGGHTPNEQTFQALQELLKNLESQVYYSASEGTLAEDKDILNQLGEISVYLNTISPELNVTQINTFKKFNDTERLEEYIAVDQEGLWSEPGKNFGPADWVKDITPEGLSQKWQKALDTLNVQEAKQERGVAPELREHLLTCITIANDTINTLSWSESTKTKMHEILYLFTQKLRGSSKLN